MQDKATEFGATVRSGDPLPEKATHQNKRLGVGDNEENQRRHHGDEKFLPSLTTITPTSTVFKDTHFILPGEKKYT
tara:strand:+ start:2479 stop:2706 length:228 start_codon:yes stop_codon:yes gene_type:complete